MYVITSMFPLPLYWITCVFVCGEYWYIKVFWTKSSVSLDVDVLNTLTSFHFLNEELDKNTYIYFLFSISLNEWSNTSLKDGSSIKFVLHHLKQMINDWRRFIWFWWHYGGLCKFSSAIVTENKALVCYFYWILSRFSYCFIAAT